MPITNDELIEALREAGNGARSVSVRSGEFVLTANGRTYDISDAQADALYTTMFGHSSVALK